MRGPTRARRALAFLALGPLAACVAERRDERAASDSTTAAQVATAAGSVGAPVAVTHERDVDLTGDGVPELVSVAARGPRRDSLAVTLVIRDAMTGRRLHQEAWSSLQYFAYNPEALRNPEQVRLIVTKNLDRLLHDAAFTKSGPPRGAVDGDVIRWDLKERAVRAELQVADTAPLPPAGYDRMNGAPADPARVRALVAELAKQPTFTYYTGGERVVTIAWSPSEGRFVRVQECC